MAHVQYSALVGGIDDVLDYYEDRARGYVDTPTLSNIRQSLDALGYDVDSQAFRLNSIIETLILKDEWDVESAVKVMEALEDDHINLFEMGALIAVEDVVKDDEDILDEDERDAEDFSEKLYGLIADLVVDPEEAMATIEETAEAIAINRLLPVLLEASYNIGERLEKFIANMIGVEREE